MREMDPAILALVGDVDFDSQAIARRYAEERDVRLRPDGNGQFIAPTGDFSHYVDDPYIDGALHRAPLTDAVEFVIVGGGFGGILAGARLRESGCESIRVIETGGDFGGTWYWNRYPGIRCDCESYVYLPLIEKIGTVPTEKYSRGSEIFEHAKAIARHFDLYRDVCFQTTVTGLCWNEQTARWHIATNHGDDIKAQFVCLANGTLVRPKLPAIPGIDGFTGHTFHTSRWDYGYTGGDETGGLVGLSDKRVGVIGTGATGVQIVPPLGEYAKHLHVFQRTPAAVDKRANRPTDSVWAASLRPGWQGERIENFNRWVAGMPQDVDLVDDGFTVIGKLLDISANWAAKILGRPLSEDEANFITETLDDKKMEEIRARVDAEVRDPKTAEALKPWHRRWCKRPLFSDDYLPTFNRPNVSLVDTRGGGVDRITANAVVVDGVEYEVDCLIFATGYEVGTEYTRRAGFDVAGRGGLLLSEHWARGMRTLHGMHSDNFPNCMFLGFGQNAVATNFVYILDQQAKHLAYIWKAAKDRKAGIVEATPDAVADYVAEVAPLSVSQHKFWVECTPSYMNSEGKNDDPHGFFANLHPAGPVVFYQKLADWRAEGKLAGLALS